MKKLLLAMSILLCAMTQAFSQAPYRIYTAPKLPVRDALDRMNLVRAWNARVLVDGNRDGIASVQIIPGKTNQLVVQTNKGAVYLYDADNGDLFWKTNVGVPFWASQPAAFNDQSIFVTRRNVLYVLNRKDGSQRVYTYDPGLKQANFGFELDATPTTTLVADDDFAYITMGDRVHAFYIPDFAAIDKARKAMDLPKKEEKGLPREPEKNLLQEDLVPTGPDSPQPVFFFGYKVPNDFMNSPPVFHGEMFATLGTSGALTGMNRYEKGQRVELWDFQAHGRTMGGAGQHGNIAYIASNDFNVYAINLNGGKMVWRYVSGAPITTRPEVNDNDIFIAPDKLGLRRLDRKSGKEVWTNRDTVRFLAANNTNVYALDGLGKFYVLDARRGTTLSKYDLSDWTIAMPNEWTDRIYLAANDGQILCLRHRDNTKPLVMKTEEVKKIEPKKEPKKEPPKKDDDKKDDDKKDDKKDDKDKEKEKAAAKMDWPIFVSHPSVKAASARWWVRSTTLD